MMMMTSLMGTVDIPFGYGDVTYYKAKYKIFGA